MHVQIYVCCENSYFPVEFTVSKTTKELNLRWKEFAPVDISKEVKMPQFEISKIIPARCQETFHIGELYNKYLKCIQKVDV